MGNVNPSSLIEISGNNSKDIRGTLLHLIEKKSWEKFESFMRENPTIALSPESGTRRLPLHLAIIKNLPIRCVDVLLSINTSTACILDASGETPLHLAITNKADDGILQLFIKKAPSCIEISDTLGVLPLHRMLEYKINTVVIIECLRAHPAAAEHKAQDGKLPLHSACEHQADIEIIQQLIQYNPTAVMEMYNRRLPIHYACEHKTHKDIVLALHKTQPNCVGTKGIDGKYPIHLAVQHRCSMEVIETLVTLYPDALTHRDRLGSLPLHYALERKASDSIVQCLVAHKPETAAIRGKGAPGNFPLSIAIDRHYSSDIIRLLLHAHPAAASEASMLRSLPLQACLQHSVTDTQLLIDILSAHPAAATAVDLHDRTVLHYAVSHSLDSAFIQALLDTAPITASAIDKNNQIPLQLAVIRKNKEIITLLLLYHPNGVVHTDRYSMNALNYAIENHLEIQQIKEIIAANKECAQNVIINRRSVLHHAVEYKCSTDIIAEIVTAYPEACKLQEELLGRLPLHWAIERLLPLPTLMCIHQAYVVQGAHVSDNRGWRSIHYAIHYPTPTELVQHLLLVNPEIAQTKSDSLHLKYYTHKRAENPDFFTPVAAEKDVFLLLHYAVEHNALPETVAEILMYTMPYTTTGQMYANHCDTWSYITSHTCDRYWRSVDIVLTRYEHIQGLLNKLAAFRDPNMQQCTDTATPRCLHEIIRRLYYFSCYDMHKQQYIHKSRYTLLHTAIYHYNSNNSIISKNPAYLDNLYLPNSHNNSSNTATTSTTTAVVLKFTNHRSKFIREVTVRTNNTLNPCYILPLLASHNAQEDVQYRQEIHLKQYAKYPFLLVTKQGDRDLSAIVKHEHLEDTDLSVIVEYTRQILQALQHLHDEIGVVHGDIKPSNIIRDEGRLKLSNFGTATRHTDKELVTAELQQLAYAAPEIALLQSNADMYSAYSTGTEQQCAEHKQNVATDSGNSNSNSNNTTVAVSDPVSQNMASQHSQEHTNSDNMVYSHDLYASPDHATNRIKSSPSQDVWSLGCILYLLLTSETVFLHTATEDLDADQLQLLCEWPDFVKQRRLDKIQDPSARCLVSQLLSKNPQHRPTAAMCLQHPFCMNTTPIVRYINIPALYDVYICYKHDKKVCMNQIQNNTDNQETTEMPTKIDVKARKLSAMQRMFGNISMSDTDSLAEESQSMTEDDREDHDSVVTSAEAVLTEQIQDGVQEYSITTTEGRVHMLRDYFHSVHINCADPQLCPLKSTSYSTNTDTSTSKLETDWSGSRESLLTQCSTAVILLTKETWLALEWCSARYKQQNKAATQEQRGQAGLTSIKHTFSTIATIHDAAVTEQSAEETEKLQLLDDFLYEIRLILELQTVGLFENGVYVFAAGEPLPVHNNNNVQNNNKNNNQGNENRNNKPHAEDRVLGEYYRQYMSEMVGRYGGSHPTTAAPTFPVQSMEVQLAQFLIDTGYGVASQHTDLTLYELFRYLVRLPTFHIVGPERQAFLSAVDSAAALIAGTAHIDQFTAAGTTSSSTNASRPNTSAYKMLRNSYIATPRLHSPNPSASGFGLLGMPDLPLGGTVSRSSSRCGSRAGLRSRGLHSSGSAVRLAPLSPTHSAHRLLTPSGRYSPTIAARPLRSPVSGLSVHAFTPKSRSTSTSRHLGYTDTTVAHTGQQQTALTSRGTHPQSRRSTPLLAPLSRQLSPATAITTPDPFLHSTAAGSTHIPIRPWSAAEPTDICNNSFRNTTNFSMNSLQPDEFDNIPENNIAYYNNTDIITIPYFTEIPAEDRARTGHALQYMTNKLEVSENEIANLHDELALLREQMHTKDAELSQLRTIVAVNSNQTIKSLPNKRIK